jgi:thiamine biosynthesis lipoprotein
MNRRDFLHPRHLAHTAGQVIAATTELASPPDSPPEIPLLHFARRAMATTFEVLLPFGTPDALSAAQAALDEIDRLEAQLSVYQDTSEVSRLNRTAATGPVPVEEGLFGLLEMAARITRETDGAFDVTAGALIKAWGFFKGPKHIPPVEERRRVLERVGMKHVRLDPELRTVHFLRPGLEINLGSIGKGYALDRCGQMLRREHGIASGLLHGGHSSVLAIGYPPGDERGWEVGISHPWEPERRMAMVRLRDRALATSAATFRHLEYNGRKLGHHLDPRLGWPAEGMASVTVVAPTAAEADALSTAFVVLGVDGTKAYCATHEDVGALLLPDGMDRPEVVGRV